MSFPEGNVPDETQPPVKSSELMGRPLRNREGRPCRGTDAPDVCAGGFLNMRVVTRLSGSQRRLQRL